MGFFSMVGDAFKDVADVAEIVGSGGTDIMAWADVVGDLAKTVSDAEGGQQAAQQTGGMGGILGDVSSLASVASMI